MAKLSASELAQRYGMSYAFFKSQPELMTLLSQAVSGQWSADRFKAALKNTGWWKNNADSVRQAQLQATTDPATFKATMNAAMVQARDAAVQAGAILNGNQLNTLARNIVYLAWTPEQINNFLGQYVAFNGDHVLGGQAGTAADQISQEAYNNGIKLSDQTVRNYAAYVVKGVSTMENVIAQIRQQAAGAYPAFADQIQAGTHVQDIAQPYVQALATELDVPVTDINVFTPKVKAALNAKDAQGNPQPMSLTDFRTSVRDDPSWRQTPDAINKTMAAGRQVLKDMGLMS